MDDFYALPVSVAEPAGPSMSQANNQLPSFVLETIIDAN